MRQQLIHRIAPGLLGMLAALAMSGMATAVEGALDPFLGAPVFETRPLFSEDRFPNVAVAMDGSILAFWDGVIVRRSEDGGDSWGPPIEVGAGFMGGGVTVDETSGDVLAFVEESHPPSALTVYRSRDHGKTWRAQDTIIHANNEGHVPSMHKNEHGITLRRGAHKGRLIRPSRWYGEGNERRYWPTHYTNAIFSDDGGKTWQASAPFPEMGTGEACVVELSDGRLYYNTRRHWASDPDDARYRWTAWSDDGGATWTDHEMSDQLPDGNQDTTYGLMGGLTRLPVADRDILVFSNIISDGGRKNGHVWVSFDGGRAWPLRRQVDPGGFAYSSLNAGRPGTPSEGWIYLLYETGGHPHSAGRMARFNLAWLLEGDKTGDGLIPDWALEVAGIAPEAAASALFVAPDGDDANAGTEDAPFKMLERARDTIRTLKQDGAFPEDGVVVYVLPGVYPVREPFQLTAEDSGTAEGPVVYRGAGAVPARFHGGVTLEDFSPLEDADALARLPEASRGQVWTTDLPEAVMENIIPFKRGGFASGRGFKTHPEMELFVDGAPMTVAAWPNDGFALTGEVEGPLTLVSWDKRPGAEAGRFRFEDERLAQWAEEPDGWLHGYWYWNWADSYEQIEAIDVDTRTIRLEEPWSRYGYRSEQRFRAVNMLCELDAPGEWYLDRERGRVYVYPESDLSAAQVELSVAAAPLMTLEDVSHVRFQNLLWECGAADGVHVRGGEDCRFEGCVIRKMVGNGLEIHGGERHVAHSCDIHTMGRGGIVLSGGDRKTLRPGGHLIENCRIHHLSRIDSTYTPGVLVGGVGHLIRNNLIHDVASSAFRVGGNDHIIERNEAHRVVLESDDQGAVDMWGDATFRGIVYRHNYWHHLGNWEGRGESASAERAGIRLDDAISGVLIEGNVFHRACATPTWFGGVQIHGGKDNTIKGNLFVDCGAGVSFTPFSEERWGEFVADALDAPAIDKELYLERYPRLARLREGPNEALVQENILVRCDALFLRAHDAVEAVDNREYPDSDAFMTGPAERLSWSAQEAERYGVEHIPFTQIGLYKNEWRSHE